MSTPLALIDLNSQVNDEPRVADLRLAEALGFTDLHKMRPLIERHRKALEHFGIVLTTADKVSATVAETLKNKGNLGGRPGKTYWLNKKQALYLCTKSEAPLATETTIQMVEVFDAWHTGHLVTATGLDEVAPFIVRGRVGRRDILVDLRDFRIGPGDEALVFGHGGKMEIMRGPLDLNLSSPSLGTRCAAGHWKKPGPDSMHGVTAERGYFHIVGRLLRPGEQRRRQLAA